MDQRTVSSVIAGRPVAGAPGGRIRSTNPARLDEVVADVELGDAALLVTAARAARDAQRAWADVPAPVRGRAIAHIGRLVEDNKEALAALVTREIGKPYPEALGEVQEIIDTCDFFLGEGRRLYGQTVPSEMPDKQLFTFRNPVGAVAVITAGNFPVAVPSWYIVPALLCGNTVVWKPAEYSAAVADAFYELFCRGGGLPPGVFNVVHADGPTTFAGLEQALDAGLIDKVGFTGPREVGARTGELPGRYLQSACLELGGKNPMVVTASADIDLAVEGALFGGFGTAGQRCTSLGTVICHESVHDDFLTRFAEATAAAAVGDPLAEVLYGPMLDIRFAERFERFLAWIGPQHKVMGSSGIGRITAANPRARFVGDPEAGIFCHPAIVDGVRPGDEIFDRETFGPLVGVTTYRTLDQAVELANAPGYGLSSSIYTTDATEAFRFRRGVSAGMVSVNNSTSGAEAHLPFGGNGKSGNGSRQSGQWVLDQFTRWQALNWDYSGRLQKAQMDVAALTPDRHFDFAARWMQQQGGGYYTISSAGHEGNAALAAALRPNDPALLHYRSGGFYCARARQVPGVDPVRDVLLGVAASAHAAIAGGRHKVFGRAELAIVPQTSTIASHLPRALGVALGIGRAAKLGVACPWPRDAVAVASFGDASARHSTAVGAINAACHTAYQGIPVPLLLVCEDNGIGISVPTPPGWVAASFGARPGLRYLAADGCDPVAAYDAAAQAASLVRSRRRPVFLHLSVVRFLGRAGSDAEAAYRAPADLAADLARDPLVATAAALVGSGLLTPAEAVARYHAIRERVPPPG